MADTLRLSTLSSSIARLLVEKKQTVGVAESSAGGLISASLLAIPGASAYFMGGTIVYTQFARRGLLQVPDDAVQGIRSSTEAYALVTLLVDKGLVDGAARDALVDTYETKVGPRNGARIVARAWIDPEFRRRLLENATEAIAELGYIGRQGEDMVALENTRDVHNMGVCTLCSCYP